MHRHLRALCATTGLLLSLPAEAPAQQGEALADSALARRLGHALDSLSASGQFSGTVLLAHHDTSIFVRAYGLADVARGTANTVETAYNLASVGKLFTQTAIEQLEHAGKLDPGANIARYWPDYPNAELARKATVAQLVSMSSGIGGEIFGTPATAHSIRTIDDYLRQFVREPLDFEPGTKRAYSNAGYVVLGALVERISGESYAHYLQQHIFTPAGMTRTGFLDSDSLPRWAAIGYTTGDENVHTGPTHPNTDMLPGLGSPAGGSYSTVGDLLRYVHAQRTGMIEGVSGKPIGWAGGTPGANTFLVPDLPGDYTLIVLANLDPPVAGRVQAMVKDWLTRGAGERR
ncbi:MAG: beta-lactamase [Gemmatimonadetes bacterium]|nr:beta-lactamase [Gemmatimonadota bacterium]